MNVYHKKCVTGDAVVTLSEYTILKEKVLNIFGDAIVTDKSLLPN